MTATHGVMTATEALLDFALNATPPDAALESASRELELFELAVSASEGAPATAIAREVAPSSGLVRDAWVSGTAVACSGTAPRWVAVCAAAQTVATDRSAATRAIAVGDEVADRVAAALGKSHIEAGWCVAATAGVIGAAVAAGLLLGLNQEQLRHAIGICSTAAAGLEQVSGTQTGAFQLGKAAGNAVEAALLARNGFTSAPAALEGRRGMFALMSKDPEPAAVEELATLWH